MIFGVGAGVLSVLFICGSYIFSREYVRVHQSPVKLAVFSQLVMSAGSLVLLAVYLSCHTLCFNKELILLIAGQVITFLLGQTAFFAVLHHVESSRVSALLGLKITVIALLAVCFGKSLEFRQWAAVILCTIGAVGMNFSGGRIPFKSCCFLALAVISYALCDMCVTELMKLMPGESMLFNSFGVIGICFSVMGAAVLPAALIKYKVNVRELKAVLPYSLLYFLSMIFLYTSFGFIGVVYGSIIQSGRGILSVLLAIVLVHYQLDRNERPVGAGKWIQRFVFAAVMVTAMLMYSLSVHTG